MAYVYGHECYYVEAAQEWRYCDTHELVDPHSRPCPQCHELPTPEGHDACLGEIPGVKFACCGHGVEDGYVSWGNRGVAYVELIVFSFTLFGWTFELVRRRMAKDDEAASGWVYS
jgi:hypothetical protein